MRVVLFAGEQQQEPCIQHGPFVAGIMNGIQHELGVTGQGGFTTLFSLGSVALR